MAKKQNQLYQIVYDAFAAAKQAGNCNEAALLKAKIALTAYYVKTPNIGKVSLRVVWADMDKVEFTQQLAYDYALRCKKKAALSTARPVVS